MDLDQVELNCPFCIDPCGNKQCEYNQEYEMSEKEINEHNFIPKDAYIKCRVRPNKDTQEYKLKVENRLKEEDVEKSPTGSLRFNKGKPEMSQLDPRFIMALADLMTVSAEKYGKFNWALGQQYHTPFDSCMRHLLKFMNGEDTDDESGKDHLLHAAANLMILWTSTKLNKNYLDTRHQWSENE